MKKFCIVFIALALAVMIPYAALATTYDFSELTVGMTLCGGDIINIPHVSGEKTSLQRYRSPERFAFRAVR